MFLQMPVDRPGARQNFTEGFAHSPVSFNFYSEYCYDNAKKNHMHVCQMIKHIYATGHLDSTTLKLFIG